MTNKENITPVIYLGGPRNGTTWLGNILNELFGIPTATHPLHYGIDESDIYRNNKYWGDFSELNNYIQFLELFSSSDYFLLTNGSKEYFYQNPQKDFIHFYLELMDQYAKSENKNNWCTKLDPEFYLDSDELEKFMLILKKRYPTFKLIAVKRNFKEYFHSYLAMNGESYEKRKKFQWIAYVLGSARYVVYYNVIERIIESYDGKILKYKDLKKDYDNSIDEIGAYLGLAKILEKTKSTPNSSFSGKRKEKALPIIVKFLFRVFTFFPYLANKILITYNKMKPSKPPVYWRLLKSKYFKENFILELDKSNDTLLINHLENNKY